MIERAAWTFAQAFLAVFVISDLASAKTAVVAAVAATLSVVKTYAQEKVAG
jgi:hypothetical protein